MLRYAVDVRRPVRNAMSAELLEPKATEANSDESGSDELIVEELLVEEISIDGMCGVY
jgi:mycofactocin precursor